MLNLRKRRIELGITMFEVAQAVGVSEAAISRYENGHIKNMGRDKITNYAKILQVEPNCIIGDGITVGIGDDNNGEAWTPAADEKSEQVETKAEQAKQWADLAIPPISEEEHEQTTLGAISQYINELLKERRKAQHRIIEINAELMLYRDFCKDIITDIKEGGFEE